MPNVNIVVLAGHLTRDAEVRSTTNTNVLKFGLAVNNRKKDQSDQWVDEPCFVDVTAFAKDSSYLANGCRKGAAVLVEGRLQLEQWQDKTTGAKRSKHSIVADKVQLLGPKGERQTAARPAEMTEQTRNEPATSNEDIPFAFLLAMAATAVGTFI